MPNTVFVLVYRTEHDDYMHISEDVQKKYPNKFVLQVAEEEPVVVEEPVIKTRRRRVKK